MTITFLIKILEVTHLVRNCGSYLVQAHLLLPNVVGVYVHLSLDHHDISFYLGLPRSEISADTPARMSEKGRQRKKL